MNHAKLCQCTHDSHTYPDAPTGTRCSKIREIRANNGLWLCIDCFDSLGLSHAAPIGTTEAEPSNRLRLLTLHADTYTDQRPTLARLQDAEMAAWAKLGHLAAGKEKGTPTVQARPHWSWKGGEAFSFLAAIQQRMEGEIAALQAAIKFENDATDRRKTEGGPIRCHAEAYRTSSAYGGAEEGGWQYTVYDLEETIPTWCHCDPMLVMKYYRDDYEGGPMSQALAARYAHEYNCEAVTALRDLEAKHTTEEPVKDEFTESYITAGGTWSMDSAEDAPPDHLGEVITRASRANYFTLSLEEAEKTDQPRPRYA